jgi:hypothetical protein
MVRSLLPPFQGGLTQNTQAAGQRQDARQVTAAEMNAPEERADNHVRFQQPNQTPNL